MITERTLFAQLQRSVFEGEGLHLQDLEALFFPRKAHVDRPVKSAGPKQGVVQALLLICGSNHKHLQQDSQQRYSRISFKVVWLLFL